MLIQLLSNKGESTVNQIAKSILSKDESQIEYYEHITKNMVGKVLTKNREITEKNKDIYNLIGFDELNQEEIDKLVSICNEKIEEYLDTRSDAWSHRKKSSGIISGTIKYEVLKRAKLRCELCSVSVGEKGLEVDHVVPRNNGGTDDISNLQSLWGCK